MGTLKMGMGEAQDDLLKPITNEISQSSQITDTIREEIEFWMRVKLEMMVIEVITMAEILLE